MNGRRVLPISLAFAQETAHLRHNPLALELLLCPQFNDFAVILHSFGRIVNGTPIAQEYNVVFRCKETTKGGIHAETLISDLSLSYNSLGTLSVGPQVRSGHHT